MTRDELLLAALARGDASTAALAQTSGLSERTCRYGLARLVKAGYVWCPERGSWRLTDAGRAIAATLSAATPAGPAEGQLTESPGADSAPPIVVERAGPSQVAAAYPAQTADQRRTVEASARPADAGLSLPGWLAWGLAALAVGVIALVYRADEVPAPSAPATPSGSSMPTGWPYNDWQNWGQ